MRFVLFVTCFVAFSASNAQTKQDKIVEAYLFNGAYKHHYLTQAWEEWINKGLQQDSTIAMLWENKALPYWKIRKYETAVAFYNNAVLYDRKRYLARRGYLKCVFQKDYKSAITDFEDAQREFGYNYESDHSYAFYIALCYLQLNEFKTAEQILQTDLDSIKNKQGESWIHYLDWFYMGIIKYELKQYNEAIVCFDKALSEYNKFSDAQYYKGLCLLEKGNISEAEKIMQVAKQNAELGFTFNEGDSPYEKYPYQVNWYMAKWIIPNYSE